MATNLETKYFLVTAIHDDGITVMQLRICLQCSDRNYLKMIPTEKYITLKMNLFCGYHVLNHVIIKKCDCTICHCYEDNCHCFHNNYYCSSKYTDEPCNEISLCQNDLCGCYSFNYYEKKCQEKKDVLQDELCGHFVIYPNIDETIIWKSNNAARQSGLIEIKYRDETNQIKMITQDIHGKQTDYILPKQLPLNEIEKISLRGDTVKKVSGMYTIKLRTII